MKRFIDMEHSLCLPVCFCFYQLGMCSVSYTANEYSIVSQPSKCIKFMSFWEGYFAIPVECKYLSEALETIYHHQFYKR